MGRALLCDASEGKESGMTWKQKYLKACMGQSRDWLESVCAEYDAGRVGHMRPIHRALIGIALRRMV